MTELHSYLTARLTTLEFRAHLGIIPEIQDSDELEELAGRIKELKRTLIVIEDHLQ